MATIIQREGRFLARVRKQGFKPVAKTFIRKADAIAWGKRVEAEMQSGRWQEASRAVPTLKQAIAEYRVKVVSKQKGADNYRWWLDEFESSAIGAKRVHEITPFDLAAWRDEQASRVAPSTVARKMGMLSGVFTWCFKERGWITGNPMHAVRKPVVSDSRERTVGADELIYLQRASSTSRASWLSDVLVVLLRSAMRRGEVFGLQRGDIDYELCIAHLADTKNGSARDVPLDLEALAALRRLDDAAKARGSSALLPLSAAPAISLAFRRTVARAKRMYVEDCQKRGTVQSQGFLSDLRLHDARHTAVTAWASTGAMTVPELQMVSGHRDMRSLNRYVNLKATALASKMSSLSLAA